MKRLVCALALGLAFTLPGHAQNAPACDIDAVKGVFEVHKVLLDRVLELMKRGATDAPGDAERLAALVHPEAEFNVGRGDADNVLGYGVEGARKFVEAVHANYYLAVDPRGGVEWMGGESACTERKIEVEFYFEPEQVRVPVEFTFVDGRITLAQGWIIHFASGELKLPAK